VSYIALILRGKYGFCALKQFDLWSLSTSLTCSEGCSKACWIVTSLCGTASWLASLLPSSLPPGRWSFGPGVTCAVKQTLFSHHVSDEAVLGRKTSFMQQHCVTLHWHVLTWFWMRQFWLHAEHGIFRKSTEFSVARASQKFAEVAPLEIPS